jgi:hypothetical protein
LQRFSLVWACGIKDVVRTRVSILRWLLMKCIVTVT